MRSQGLVWEGAPEARLATLQQMAIGILTLYTGTLPCKWWCPFILVEKAMFSNGQSV